MSTKTDIEDLQQEVVDLRVEVARLWDRMIGGVATDSISEDVDNLKRAVESLWSEMDGHHSLTHDGRCVVDANDWDNLNRIKDTAWEVCHVASRHLPLPQELFDALYKLRHMKGM